jgi:hypothetical protein
MCLYYFMNRLAVLLLLVVVLLPLSYGAEYRDISFRNHCCEQINLYIRAQTSDGSWETYGPWSVLPCGTTFLRESATNTRVQTANPIIYIYAEVVGGGYYWKGDHNVDFLGRTLPMRKVTFNVDSDGSFINTITCTERSPCGDECNPYTYRSDEPPSKSARGCYCGHISGGE